MVMRWILVGVALLFALINFASYARWGRGALLHGLAWVVFAGYLGSGNQTFLYTAVALYVIGVFFRRPVQRQPGQTIGTGEQEGTGPYTAPPPPLPCVTEEREIEVPLTLDVAVSLPTADGRTLTFAPGTHPVRARFRLMYRDAGQEDFPIDSFNITQRVGDAAGQEWYTEAPMTPELIDEVFTHVLEAQAAGTGEAPALHREETAPEAWREAITRHALLCGVRDCNDSRMIYDLTIDGQPWRVQLKYQVPQFDIAWLPEERAFVARVSGLQDLQRIEQANAEGVEELPACYFLLPPSSLLLRTTTWYTDSEGTRHESGDTPTLTFIPTGAAATPDAGITVSK